MKFAFCTDLKFQFAASKLTVTVRWRSAALFFFHLFILYFVFVAVNKFSIFPFSVCIRVNFSS